MNADRLRGVLGAIDRAHVLCVGDVMLDRFVHGDVERVSQEAPIPIVRVAAQDEVLGGAGNVVRNVAALGGRATLLSVMGDDAAGRAIDALLAREPRIAAELVPEAGAK